MISSIDSIYFYENNNRLQESETKLNEITKDQNMNAEGFVALMRQNKNFLDKMDVGETR